MISARWFKTLAAVVCLSTLSPSALAVQIAQAPTPIAQATIDCSAERRDIPLAAVNEQIERTRQLVNDRQTEAALRSLTETIQAIGRLQDVSIKASLLDSLVNSVFGDRSLIEQLVHQASHAQRQRVVAVLPQAVQIAQSLNSGYSAVKTRSLTSIARYYAMLGYWQQSQAVLGQALQASRFLRGVDFQAPALVGIAQGYVSIRQPQTAAPLIAQALPLAQSIANPSRQAATLAQISNLHMQLNQIDRALQIARSIAVPYYQTAATLAIADRYLGGNQIDRALELVQPLPASDQKALMLALIAGRLTAPQPPRAAQIYAQAVATARSTANPNQTLASVAQRYVESSGLVATADETILAISDPAVKVPALGSIALFYASAGQEELSETRLRQAIDLLKSISDSSSRTFTLQQLMDQMLLRGRYDYALQVAQTMQPDEGTPPFDRESLLIDLANRAIAADRYDAAIEIAQAISPMYADARDRLFVQIARGLAEAGEFDRAQEIAQQDGQNPGFRPRVLAAVAAQIQRVAQQIDPATALFNQAVQLANAIDQPGTKAEVLAEIAIERFTANQPEEASQLINQAIATAEALPDRIDQFSVLSRIAENLITANQYRAAIQVAEAIPEESERIMRLNQAIEKAVNANDFTAVLPVIDRLDSPVLKTRWRIALADRYAQLGQTQRSIELLNQAFQTARTVPGDESRTIVVRGGENRLEVDDDQDRGSFYEAIALRFARLNQTGRALEVARSLQEVQARQQVLQRIGCYQ